MAKKQKKQYGMGPAQSMAMAGNTGLASFTEKDINRVQQEKRAYNDFSGRDRNERASYTDIGQEIDELASKYRRPVKIADGFGAYSPGSSGRRYTPNDFNADGSFRSFTATQPTASQVFGRDGDVRRAFKGYNALKYDDPGQGYSPVSMRYNRGIYEQGGGLPGLLSNMVSPGSGFVMQALRDLVSGYTPDDGSANKVKPSDTIENFMEATYPTMREPRGDGVIGAYDKLANLAKGMLGADNYKTTTEETRKAYDDLVNQTDSSYKETSDEVNKTVEDMSDVEKEIFLNPKLKFARNDSAIRLALEQENDAKELKKIRDKIEAEKQQFNNRLKEIMQQDNIYTSSPTAATSQIPSEAAGITALTDYFKNNIPQGFLPENYDALKEEAKQLVNQGGDYFKNNIPQGFLPENYDALKEEAKQLVNQGGEELNKANSTQREINPFSFLNPFDNIPTGVALTEALSPDSLNLSDMGLILGDTTVDDLTEQGKQFYDYYTGEEGGMSNEEALKNIKVLQSEPSNVSKYGDLLLSSNSITPYNNAFNLEFRNQEGATPGYGGDDGQRFASFEDLDVGLKTGVNRISEIVGDGRSTEGFLNIYAPRSDNKKSFDNYLAELVKRVGPTIEPNEIKELSEGVVKFENKPEIADKYLAYLQANADKIYSGIVA